MSAGDDGQHLRTVGPRRRRPLQQVQLPGTRLPGRRRAAVHPAREGIRGLQDGPQQLRAVGQHRLAARTCSPGSCARSSAIPSQATIRAGYSDGLRPPGPHPVHDPLWGQPRRVDFADPQRQHRPRAGRASRGRCCSRRPVVCTPRPFNPDPTYPIAVGANRADNLNAFTPDIEIARVQTWTVGFARSISKDMAVEIRYVGNRGDNEWSSINYNCGTTNGNNCTGIRGENLVANGFMDEFKLAMANLQANNASGVANRAGSFAYFGGGTGTSPLPIYLAYLNGRTDAGNPAAYGLNANVNLDHLRERHDRRPARRTEPEPERGGGRSRRQPDAPEPGPGGRIPVELLHRQSRRRQRQRDRQRRVQQVQRAAARAPAAPVEGLLREPELSVRVRGRVAVRRLQLRPRVDRRAGDRQPDRPPRASSSRRTGRCRSAAANGSAAT